MLLLDQTKKFIENNIDLINQESWRTLFIETYNECLTTAEIMELHHVLEDTGIFDSTQLRSELLYEEIEHNLSIFKRNNSQYKTKYLVQFLRQYLNNYFGFTEEDTLDLVYQNQPNLGITLIPTDKKVGSLGIQNYEIEFDIEFDD